MSPCRRLPATRSADHRGAVVALRPETGDVLAFVSTPDYDPNLFASGFGLHSYDELRTSPDKPLLNRALIWTLCARVDHQTHLGNSGDGSWPQSEKEIFLQRSVQTVWPGSTVPLLESGWTW